MTKLKFFQCTYCDYITENKSEEINDTGYKDCCGKNLACSCTIDREEVKRLTKNKLPICYYIEAFYYSQYNGSVFRVKDNFVNEFLKNMKYTDFAWICDFCIKRWLKHNLIKPLTYWYHEDYLRPEFDFYIQN